MILMYTYTGKTAYLMLTLDILFHSFTLKNNEEKTIDRNLQRIGHQQRIGQSAAALNSKGEQQRVREWLYS